MRLAHLSHPFPQVSGPTCREFGYNALDHWGSVALELELDCRTSRPEACQAPKPFKIVARGLKPAPTQ